MIPPTIDRDACPGGLVVVLVNAAGEVVEQSELEDAKHEGIVLTALYRGEHVKREGASVAIYDGDTGHLVIILTAGGGMLAPGPGSRFN